MTTVQTIKGQIVLPSGNKSGEFVIGTTLQIHGYTITLDFRQLSHDLKPELLGRNDVLSRTTTHQLTLVPCAKYMFVLARGMALLEYQLTTDGQVTVPAAHSGYATATGTTLQIHGYTITLDFRGQHHDILPSLLGAQNPLPHKQPHQLTLIAATYLFQSRRDSLADINIAVRLDGSIHPA